MMIAPEDDQAAAFVLALAKAFAPREPQDALAMSNAATVLRNLLADHAGLQARVAALEKQLASSAR